jgi:poly-gamma-glutamate synthesis protein (capsule biosynthesis protein)
MSSTKFIARCACLALTLAACSPQQPNPTTEPTSLPNITIEFAPTATPTLAPTPTPTPVKTVWIDPVLPSDIHDALKASFGQLVQNEANANARLELTTDSNADVRVMAESEGVPLITRTLAVAVPFPTVSDDISFDALKQFWSGDAAALASLSGDKQTPPTLFLDPNTRAALVLLLGKPAESLHIQMVSAQDLLATTWAARPTAFAILPFDQLEARWKLLHVDGVNLFEREADMSEYPLTLSVRAVVPGSDDLKSSLLTASDNRDLSKMAIAAMTGVTAMVRGTAVRMEQKGITYPAEKIRDWLTTADVTHISNEVSFREGCPAPSFNSGVVMCSDPKYIELLEYVGTDVVELTGNHTWDYGAKNLLPTIQMYEERGWRYFGGGKDAADAQRPVTMTVNGNKLAFVGCNYFGVNWATNQLPGSTVCGTDSTKDLGYMTATIQELRAQGYLVIATLQYEEYYFYESTLQQRRDFAALRDAGAVVVNGSQGHHVQAFDVSGQGFIHWGTGNIFFGDQTFSRGAQTTMVDRHVFYDNKYLGADLRTAFIEDSSQPVPMNEKDRAELLETLFEVSRFQ